MRAFSRRVERLAGGVGDAMVVVTGCICNAPV